MCQYYAGMASAQVLQAELAGINLEECKITHIYAYDKVSRNTASSIQKKPNFKVVIGW